jgi:hypothetical protein
MALIRAHQPFRTLGTSFRDIRDEFMDEAREEWVTPRQASEEKKVGLSQHRISELARDIRISSRQIGIRRLVKVLFNDRDKTWELAWIERPKRGRDAGETIPHTGEFPVPNSPSEGRESDSEENIARHLVKKNAAMLAGKSVSMAQLFWFLGEFFLAGIDPASIFPSVLTRLTAGSDDEKAAVANCAASELMFELRRLQLVRNENRYGVMGRGYSVVVATELGARVMMHLQSPNWPK